jgi:hypothetical protein
MALALLELSDLTEPQRVKIDLPTAHLGDRLRLNFTLERRHAGRTEVLAVTGEFKVISVVIDTTLGRTCQIVQVASTGKAPAWLAIKNRKPIRLPPARAPKMIVT